MGDAAVIYEKGDFVVVDGSRIGLVERRFREDGKRRYVLKMGADGPHEQASEARLRPASVEEARNLEVARDV